MLSVLGAPGPTGNKSNGFPQSVLGVFSLGRGAEDRCFCCRGGAPTFVLETPGEKTVVGFPKVFWVFFSGGGVGGLCCFFSRGGPPTCVLETQGETALQ